MSQTSEPLFSSLPSPERPYLMGIVNVTPDSFYDGGHHDEPEAAVNHALDLAEAGADVLDIGGESTRPGADPVSLEEERRRVVPVIQALADRDLDQPISIDTTKAEVAERCLEAGAEWVNDVTALRADPDMARVVADHEAALVLMHMQGTPRDMQQNPEYDDVVIEVRKFLEERVQHAVNEGVSLSKIMIDPGVGFGKTLSHNRRLLTEVDRFRRLGLPVMVGHSRKSFLDGVLDRGVEDRLAGTLAVSSSLIEAGVDVLRVHDVQPHDDLRRLRHWQKGVEFRG